MAKATDWSCDCNGDDGDIGGAATENPGSQAHIHTRSDQATAGARPARNGLDNSSGAIIHHVVRLQGRDRMRATIATANK